MSTLEGKKVCVTGKLSRSRAEIQTALKALGATIAKSVTADTDLLVAGDKAGSKLAAAQKHGVPVLGQTELDALLDGQALDQVLGGAETPTAAPKATATPKATAAPPPKAAPEVSGKPHQGQVFVLTGDLDIERSAAKKQLQSLGARVTGSVSGKTTALLCGREPGGSKISKAESQGIPVIDEAGVGRLLAGEPLSALAGAAAPKPEATERTPLPTLPERVDGPYRTTHPGSDQVEYEGTYERGRMHGTWKRYHPNGQLAWQVGWQWGQRQGPIEAFHENGQKSYVGEYLDDRQHGIWEYWYDDGSFFQRYCFEHGDKTGDYVCDERDGSPRARGQFRKGKLHGSWQWWNQKDHERIARGYLDGMFHGMSEAWYPGGQLAERKEYTRSGLTGVFEEYFPDGKPKRKGLYDANRKLVRMETWDESGKSTVEEGSSSSLPPKLVNDPAQLEKLAARLKKAKDEYKKDDVLEKAAGEWSLKYPLLLHLFREDVYDLGADASLWRFLAENAHLMTGEDVAKLLKSAKPSKDDVGPHLPKWPASLDEMVMRVYARDPEPIDAVLPELKGALATGVKFCLARFGKDVKVGDQSKGLVDKIVNHYGIGDRILWPEGDGVEWRDLLGGAHRAEPTEHFGAFLELLTDVDSFEEALLAATMKACEMGHRSLPLATLRPALQRATPEQLGTILDQAQLGDQLIETTRKIFFEWRKDDAQTVTDIAMASKETGLRRWPMVACAILKRKEEGLAIPDELVSALPLDGVSVGTQWIIDAIAKAIPQHDQRSDVHRLAQAVVFADHDSPGNPRNELLLQALRALSPEQLRARIEAQLEEKYGQQNVAPYLFLVDDEELWKTAIEAIAASEYGGGHTVAYGLGTLPMKALPLIHAGRKKAAKKNQDAWDRAALLCVTRAIERGEAIDDQALQHIRFDLGGKYDWSYVQPILLQAVYSLPRAQGETVLLAGLSSSDPTTFARAFRLIECHPTTKVMERAMHGLLSMEAKLKSGSESEIQAGLQSLPTMYVDERRAYVKWLMINGGGAKLKQAFQGALGHKELEALEKELAEGGAEVAKELDKVDQLLALAERARGSAKGGTEPIFVMRRLEKAPTEATLNLSGGMPPGIDAERWPTFDDEPMVHLFTLDLETMPELRARHEGKRTLSFFCYSPGHNEAWEAGNDQTALLGATADEVGTEHEPPEDAEVRSQGHFEVVRVEVPSGVWGAKSGLLGELRGAIYGLGARALGSPLWLQSDEGGALGFVMQFDESFVDINLGDMGIMYVYSDGGFWQCH